MKPMSQFRSSMIAIVLLVFGLRVAPAAPFDALIKAAALEDLAGVRRAIEAGARPEGADDFGGTALHYAASKGNLEIAQLLLEKGAGLDVQDYRGQTALMVAARRAKLAMARFLLEKGANYGLKNKAGASALMIAIADGKSRDPIA